MDDKLKKVQELLALSSRCSQYSAHGVEVGYRCTTVRKFSPSSVTCGIILFYCLITVGSEKDSIAHVFFISFIYSFYNYILCPGIVTGAEHTQIRNTKFLFLWFFSEEPKKQI